MKLPTTAVRPAKNVPNKYNPIIDCILVFLPSLCCDIADITKKNTNIGATAFNAPTNNDPNNVTTVACGSVIPNIIPIINPIIILCTKLILLKFVAKFDIILPPNFILFYFLPLENIFPFLFPPCENVL